MKNYKICVVGAGRWGLNHIKTLEKLHFLGGVVDSNNLTLIKIKKEFPECLTFENLEDSFKINFDAYIVATHQPLILVSKKDHSYEQAFAC